MSQVFLFLHVLANFGLNSGYFKCYVMETLGYVIFLPKVLIFLFEKAINLVGLCLLRSNLNLRSFLSSLETRLLGVCLANTWFRDQSEFPAPPPGSPR